MIYIFECIYITYHTLPLNVGLELKVDIFEGFENWLTWILFSMIVYDFFKRNLINLLNFVIL